MRGKLLNAQKAVRTVRNSEQKLFLKKALFPTLIKGKVDVNSTEFSGREISHSHQSSAVLVLARSKRVQKVDLVLLRSDAKRNLDFVNLEDGEPELLASLRLRVRRENGDLLPRDVTVDGNPDDVLETLLDAAHGRRLWASEEYRLTTGRGAYVTQRAKVPCVEAAGVEIAQSFRHLGASVEMVGVSEVLALHLNFLARR